MLVGKQGIHTVYVKPYKGKLRGIILTQGKFVGFVYGTERLPTIYKGIAVARSLNDEPSNYQEVQNNGR